MAKREHSDTKHGGASIKRLKFKRTGIEKNESGILITVPRGKERQASNEIINVLSQHVATLWPETIGPEESDDDEGDLEEAISRELEGMKEKKKSKKELLTPILIDLQCVVFIKIRPPIDPVRLVEYTCKEGKTKKMTRFTQRLTPIVRTTGASIEELEDLALEVLKPHFHEGQQDLKFAVQATIRNHSILKKDDIYRSIAKCVGREHKVDLKNYDLLIMVQVFKNIIGMSVVRDYEQLRRFNLNELYQPGSSKVDEKTKPVEKEINKDENKQTAEAKPISDIPEPKESTNS
ncbi:tRNA acetyltransferase [Schizosaccharomyces cryophilus OY26]|uniref:tRNA acetyltransferase n=1 Tax=Schizosaccharomyces cryophilus (strain OY26 / ATCC MYA-4695 / CBS 11777 / NBRC 106824 / NRRL Y48691) TaxID=653667 RepID=S9VRX6_SCHCR|nr:tRNA acetyltransferase [Schizosaccharomyces cryophilus OY26]EPY50693.1 tRNA acetyltransferase [Schizosaccharomyces cryophilus OY26]